ncbi:uncharacterized protein LOC111330582 [Stylophora pistillata]|uniref:uncharacterized protein LOC111330582 n=1 Tax=Stylophora pistillata TaxID=50429 RepID=UPI000C03D011|nr:uncharacterized protein LOC111330582 [Stylophora pistillata]
MNLFSQSCCGGCDAHLLRYCGTSQQNSKPFSSCSYTCNGFSHKFAIKHMPSGVKNITGSLNTTSSQMKSEIHQASADSAFFLRPHLTREEYAYWNSNFCHFLHSCDRRTVTYQHKEPSYCVRRIDKGLPCRSERTPDPCCDQMVLSRGTCAGLQHSKVKFASKPEEKMNVDARTYSSPRPRYAGPVLENGKKHQTISKGNVCFKKNSIFKRSVPSLRRTKGKHSDDTPDHDIHGVNEQSKAAELRKRLSELYLCGDQSYEDNPSALNTSKRAEKFKTGSAEFGDATGTYAVSSALSSHSKRKSSSLSEHDSHHEGKRKKQRVSDDVSEKMQKTSNNSIDLNDTLESFLKNSSSFLGSFTEEASRKRSETPKMSRLSGMEEETVHGDLHMGEKSNPPNFDGNQDRKIRDATGDLSSTNSADDVTMNSQVLRAKKVIPKEKCKNVSEVIKTTKPVQRKLVKNSKSSLHGSYALDYDCLPKLVNVLSLPEAKVSSSLKA